MIRILFVCHGNICRSPMAEYIMKYLVKEENLASSFEISSCATSNEEIGNDIYSPAKKVLDKHKIPYEYRQARRITKNDFKYYDYIIVMDENNIRYLRYSFDEIDVLKAKTLLSFTNDNRDVADPWYTGGFETAYKDIYKGCKALLEYIKENNKDSL